MFRRRLAALFLAAIPVSCTAQVAPATSATAPQGTQPATTPAPSTDAGAWSAGNPAPAAPAAAGTPKITFSQCHVDGPYIAMTFDDGPHAQNTPRLLEMLKQRGIKATFFLVGQCAKEYPDLVKRIVAEGHEVASHSWSHPLLSKMSDEAVKQELQKTQDAIVQACGVTPKIMRPPYGGFTARQRAWCYGEFGYKCILWDVDPLDWKVRNAAHVEKEILQQTVAGSIVLSHDIHKTTVDAMPSTLDALAAKGFKFVTVSELIAMDKPVVAKPKATTKGSTKSAPAEQPAPPAAPATETTSAPKAEPVAGSAPVSQAAPVR